MVKEATVLTFLVFNGVYTGSKEATNIVQERPMTLQETQEFKVLAGSPGFEPCKYPQCG